jgi:hypothetical protein
LPNEKEKGESSNLVEVKEEETLLVAIQDVHDIKLGIWYVDIGCTNHMT